MVSDRYEDKDTHLIPNRNRSPQPIFRHRHSLPGILPRHFSSVRALAGTPGRLRPFHSLAPALSRGRTHLPPATTTSSAAPPKSHPAASRHRTPPQQPPAAPRSRVGSSLPARRPAVPARPAGCVPADETTSDENTRQRKPNDNSRQQHPTATRSLTRHATTSTTRRPQPKKSRPVFMARPAGTMYYTLIVRLSNGRRRRWRGPPCGRHPSPGSPWRHP